MIFLRHKKYLGQNIWVTFCFIRNFNERILAETNFGKASEDNIAFVPKANVGQWISEPSIQTPRIHITKMPLPSDRSEPHVCHWLRDVLDGAHEGLLGVDFYRRRRWGFKVRLWDARETSEANRRLSNPLERNHGINAGRRQNDVGKCSEVVNLFLINSPSR